MSRTLIHNGTVVDVEPVASARAHCDLLIEDGRIAAVGPALAADGARVIDATDRIVLPGFVDTHRHTWQTALRGIAADADLGEYLDLVLGRIGPRYTASDVYAGTLAGAREALAAGITTLQDFSHVQYSPAHTEAAVAALRASGIRAVFGYGAAFGHTPAYDEIRRVRREHFAEDGLLSMALAPSGPSYSDLDTVRADWGIAKELGLRIFAHLGGGTGEIRMLDANGLLDERITFVHGNALPDEDLTRIADAGAAVSIAPAVEAQMGHGAPMVNRLCRYGVTTGLGVDVVTTVAGDMFSLMRAALLTSQLSAGGRLRAADVLRLATIEGAAALGLAGQIGSLRPGKQADLVLLRADDLNLLGGRHDPIGTVVTSANSGNVEAVFVAGERVDTTVPTDVAVALTESAARLAA
jgi:cytosine/adenosine deaminase-related metal-dependent hydrolase